MDQKARLDVLSKEFKDSGKHPQRIYETWAIAQALTFLLDPLLYLEIQKARFVIVKELEASLAQDPRHNGGFRMTKPNNAYKSKYHRRSSIQANTWKSFELTPEISLTSNLIGKVASQRQVAHLRQLLKKQIQLLWRFE